ncbi:GerAB/ArcD/ProY family transporter [Pseudobacillus wudalianchiensis]|uniref:Spore gernimation protein GerB n=1 Tax=Pseudobacillus wudalianchiensis TaxID=1743143 RepID=A0A1B9B6P5_9BACI|nr:GerAB/ArcD/ProY family transporter [Bacillus wudalianchiensis]OCA91766.1 spore gernimation protein GerB [Bacillus wudalianchiensis]
MLPLPPEARKVSPYLVFFLIITTQIGVGILGFERYIAKPAGYDAWISILISGLSVNLIIWMTYYILNKGNNDITVIHKDLFGKWIGGILSLLFAAYMVLMFITVLRTYIEIIQIWMFPQLQTWYMALIMAITVWLYVVGGFRVLVGLCVLSFFITLPLLLLKGFAFKSLQLSYLFPILDSSAKELLAASKIMSINYTGFEVIFFCYPFIKNAPRSQKWAQYGVFFTTFVYVITALISFMYFSHGQLEKTVWATLTLWKIVDFPFLERFEYFGISLWFFTILPNLCLYLWAATRGLKQLFSIKQKHSLTLLLFIGSTAALFFKDRLQIDQLNTLTGSASFFILYAYIPFIFLCQLMKKRSNKNSGNQF